MYKADYCGVKALTFKSEGILRLSVNSVTHYRMSESRAVNTDLMSSARFEGEQTVIKALKALKYLIMSYGITGIKTVDSLLFSVVS